jgi:hypothetical protein
VGAYPRDSCCRERMRACARAPQASGGREGGRGLPLLAVACCSLFCHSPCLQRGRHWAFDGTKRGLPGRRTRERTLSNWACEKRIYESGVVKYPLLSATCAPAEALYTHIVSGATRHMASSLATVWLAPAEGTRCTDVLATFTSALVRPPLPLSRASTHRAPAWRPGQRSVTGPLQRKRAQRPFPPPESLSTLTASAPTPVLTHLPPARTPGSLLSSAPVSARWSARSWWSSTVSTGCPRSSPGPSIRAGLSRTQQARTLTTQMQCR